MQELVSFLIENNISISCAESFTVGNFAARIGAISGVSAIFKGAFVTYQNQIKERVLGVSHEIIVRDGVVSEEVARQMAILCQEKMNSRIAVSFTGNAGPKAMEDKPVGLCYIGICIDDYCEVLQCCFKGNREEIVNQAIDCAVEFLKNNLNIRRM